MKQINIHHKDNTVTLNDMYEGIDYLFGKLYFVNVDDDCLNLMPKNIYGLCVIMFDEFKKIDHLPDYVSGKLELSHVDIKDLKLPNGIEDLSIRYCNLTNLDFFMPNTIRNLDISNNKIKHIDFHSKLYPYLLNIDASFNELETFKIDQIIYLNCKKNNLISVEGEINTLNIKRNDYVNLEKCTVIDKLYCNSIKYFKNVRTDKIVFDDEVLNYYCKSKKLYSFGNFNTLNINSKVQIKVFNESDFNSEEEFFKQVINHCLENSIDLESVYTPFEIDENIKKSNKGTSKYDL